MADELHTPNHRWYEPRNHIALAKEDVSKQWIFNSGIQKINAWINSQPWGNPIAALFANNEPGVWYDPSDLSTLFQDTAGTTPVTTPGQTVALMLDKSKGLTLGPELVTNGTFDTDVSGWTDSSTGTGSAVFSSGTALLTTNDSSNRGRLIQSLALTSGRFYRLSFVGSSATADSGGVFIGGVLVASAVGNGLRSVVFLATGTSNLEFFGTFNSGSIAFDNISVRELPGFHATQSITSARPTYGIVPAGGRRNLLRFSEQFDNAAWVKGGTTVSANAGVAPDGTTTAERLTENTATSEHIIYQQITLIDTIHSHSVYLKASERNLAYVWIQGTNRLGAVFDLSTGTITSTGLGITATILDVGGGWYRCSVTRASVVAGTCFVGVSLIATGTTQSYAGDGTSSIFLWGAQLEEGSTATAYQKVTTQFDVTEAGVESLGKLFFDGVDDIMISPSAIFYGSESSMILGAETFALAGQRTIASDSTNVGLQFATTQVFGFVNNFTTGSGGIQLNQAYPNGRVVSWLRGQSQNSALLRVDGVGVASTTHNQADNVSRPLTVGGKVAGPFGKMDFYSLVHIARFIDETELSNTEAYVAGKTAGIFAPVINGAPTIGASL